MSLIFLLAAPILLALCLLQNWLLYHILRQQGQMLLRIEWIEAQLAPHEMLPLSASSISVSSHLTTAITSETSSGEGGADIDKALTETPPRPPEAHLELTIGMATYNDFDGVYFTLQALRLYQDLEQTEVLVIDNYGCQETKKLVEGLPGARYIRAADITGTAAPRERIFKEARGNAVLCCDCHVLFAPGVIAQLKQFYREHPECDDLLQGPLLFDDGKPMATHFDPVWRAHMWGTWGMDPRGLDPESEPFEIPMQGLGVFSCRRSAWLGFHPEFRGFGGEEGYIHEKFRQAGHRCLCLPWFRWMHRFGRPSGPGYLVTLEDRLRNYVIGHDELGLDLVPVLRHFSASMPEDRVIALAEQALGGKWTGSAFICEEEPQESSIPLVSVVLPVYNGERYLRAAVESLLTQTLQQIEIMIVNDGSTDSTEEIITALSADPRVRALNQSHLGIAKARNTGMARARASYIAVHDADDLSLPPRLETQYRFLEQYPEACLVAARTATIDETGQVKDVQQGLPTGLHEVQSALRQGNFLVHGSVMLRKSACEAVGNYREAFVLSGDYDLWLRLAERSPFGYIAKVLYQRRAHPESVTSISGPLQGAYAQIAGELAQARRLTGSDLLQAEGSDGFFRRYEAQLKAAGFLEGMGRPPVLRGRMP